MIKTSTKLETLGRWRRFISSLAFFLASLLKVRLLDFFRTHALCARYVRVVNVFLRITFLLEFLLTEYAQYARND